jgi:copper chaperone CopZ
MRLNRSLSILGLVAALPLLTASYAFSCEKDAATASAGTCAAKAATASVGTCAAKTADAKTASAGTCAAKSADAASAGTCAAKSADAKTAGAGCCGGAATAATADAKTAGADCGSKAANVMSTYKVAGMTCGGCVSQVEAAVAKLENASIQECKVSLENGQAVVVSNGPVCTETVAQAITDAGFKAEYIVSADENTSEEPKAETETEEAAATM